MKVEEITGFSNTITGRLIWEMGLEEDEITWYSNLVLRLGLILCGLEECEITWFSNINKSTSHCFVRKQNYMVLKPYTR